MENRESDPFIREALKAAYGNPRLKVKVRLAKELGNQAVNVYYGTKD